MTEKEVERSEFYMVRYAMNKEAADWAAKHESMPEFRELTFVTDNYTIMPQTPRKRTLEEFDDRPLPGWLNAAKSKETLRLYWGENLTITDCAYYLKEPEQDVRLRVRDLRAWYNCKDIKHCGKCTKAFDKLHLANDTTCFRCFTKKVGNLYK